MPRPDPVPALAARVLRLTPEQIAAQTEPLVPRLETLADRECLPGPPEHDTPQQQEFREVLRLHFRDRYDRLLMVGAHPATPRARLLIGERWPPYGSAALQLCLDWLRVRHHMTLEDAWRVKLPDLVRLLEEDAGGGESGGSPAGLWASAADLARRHSLDQRKLEGRLNRWRAKNQRLEQRAWLEVPDPRPRQPRFLYHEPDVLSVIEALRACGERATKK